MTVNIIIYTVAAIFALWILGWNYSIFADKCRGREISNKLSFAVQLIPYVSIIFSLGGWVFELFLLAPNKLRKEIRDCYNQAFPKPVEKRTDKSVDEFGKRNVSE